MEINKEDIKKMEYRLIEAISTSDLDFLEGVMHNDLVGLTPNGQKITKQMDLDSHRAGNMKVEKIAPNLEEVKIIGDTAVVIITYDTKGIMLGTPIEGKFKYNRIWKKIDGELKIISVSCMQID